MFFRVMHVGFYCLRWLYFSTKHRYQVGGLNAQANLRWTRLNYGSPVPCSLINMIYHIRHSKGNCFSSYCSTTKPSQASVLYTSFMCSCVLAGDRWLGDVKALQCARSAPWESGRFSLCYQPTYWNHQLPRSPSSLSLCPRRKANWNTSSVRGEFVCLYYTVKFLMSAAITVDLVN